MKRQEIWTRWKIKDENSPKMQKEEKITPKKEMI
jgi:hypothetical protein